MSCLKKREKSCVRSLLQFVYTIYIKHITEHVILMYTPHLPVVTTNN